MNLHEKITERLDELETRLKAPDPDPESPGAIGRAFIGACLLRNLAEDRDILARHREMERMCAACSLWEDESDVPMALIPWPCPDIESLARRHGIEVQE